MTGPCCNTEGGPEKKDDVKSVSINFDCIWYYSGFDSIYMYIKCIQFVFPLDFEQTLPINYMFRKNEKNLLYNKQFVIILNFQIQG